MATPEELASAAANGATPATEAVTPSVPTTPVTPGQFTVPVEAVYAPDNVNAATIAPATRPDLSDPLGIRDFYLNSLGIPTIQSDVQKAREALDNFNTEASNRQNYIEGQTVAMPVIRGQQATQQNLDTTKRNSLSSTLLAKTSLLSALSSEADRRTAEANSLRGELTQLITSSPGAGITYADSVEEATSKAYTWQKTEAKKAADAAYKQSLKSALLSLGEKTKGSTKELEKRLAKINKSAQKDLKAQSKLQLQTAQAQLDNLLKKGSGSGSGGLTNAEIKTANENAIYAALSDARGARSQAEGDSWDGFLAPADWQPLLNMWTSAGGSATEFFKTYGGVAENGVRTAGFINPNDI